MTSTNAPLLLVINFGSTSTKIAVFTGEESALTRSFDHGTDAYPKKFSNLADHRAFAEQLIEELLAENDYKLEDFDVFVARGGAQVFIESGAYLINDIMYEDALRIGGEHHPGKLGTLISYGYSQKYGKPAYIVNGPSVDEFDDLARPTGLHDIWRQSRIHTLNQKEVAYRYARENGLAYKKLNLIICHIGGGISVTAHRGGRMVDSNDIIKGEGPMTPTRAGSLPALDLFKLCYSGRFTEREMKDRLSKNGGLIDHLGTADAKVIEQRIAEGDHYAQLVYDAMLYQVAKNIGACAVTLQGDVKAIILTGGLANSTYVIDAIRGFVNWIAPLVIMAGEFEMEALAAGALRVAKGQEEAHIYTGDPVWSGFERL